MSGGVMGAGVKDSWRGRQRFASWVLVLSCELAVIPAAFGYVTPIPANLAQETLAETVPSAFVPTGTPAGLHETDWEWEQLGSDPHDSVWESSVDIEWSWVPGSLEWVRVSDVLVLPRARVRARIRTRNQAKPPQILERQIAGAIVEVAGGAHVFTKDAEGTWIGEFPVALLEGQTYGAALTLVFAGAGGTARTYWGSRAKWSGVSFDTSCSRYQLSARFLNPGKNGFVYVGCRLVVNSSAEYSISDLELWVYWDGAHPGTVKVDQVPTRNPVTGLIVLRQGRLPGKVRIEVPNREPLEMEYKVGDRFYHLMIGAGLGPYSYHFDDQGQSSYAVIPEVTLYGSYFIQEPFRVVFFGIAALNERTYADVGLYLSLEQIKALDRRVAVNLLLGAHSIAFKSGGLIYGRFSAPQGLELIVSDFILRNYSLALGSFLLPEIKGQAYTNAWVRFGSPRLFVEINYIRWKEAIEAASVGSESLGVTIGMPLFRFL